MKGEKSKLDFKNFFLRREIISILTQSFHSKLNVKSDLDELERRFFFAFDIKEEKNITPRMYNNCLKLFLYEQKITFPIFV